MFCARRALPAGSVEPSVLEPSVEASVTVPIPSFPIEPSSTGKRFYAFTTRSQCQGREAFLVFGHRRAVAWLGGSWTSCGTAPRGFIELGGFR